MKKRIVRTALIMALGVALATVDCLAADWKKETNDQESLLKFHGFVRKFRKAEDPLIMFYLTIKTMENQPTPVPAPLQCKDQDDRTAEVAIQIAGNPKAAKYLGTTSKAAADLVDIPKQRQCANFQQGRGQMETGGYQMSAIRNELTGKTKNDLDSAIQGLYDDYKKNAKKFEGLENEINTVKGQQAAILQKDLKNKEFVLYPKIEIGNTVYPYYIEIGTKKVKFSEFCEGTPIIGKIIEKKGDTVFRYSGSVGRAQMLHALKGTGWAPAMNLKQEDLEQVK